MGIIFIEKSDTNNILLLMKMDQFQFKISKFHHIKDIILTHII